MPPVKSFWRSLAHPQKSLIFEDAADSPSITQLYSLNKLQKLMTATLA